ncbi:hypothetical protein TIFTF001_028548 [Ficus carica]|uniref:Transmembrane protein n=1 Tax=Ficus carica TaxID=3494 RepID=A0AA88DQ44_FICCA|nr:hypothetical protein TIFTF001_028548 [Ficus carica]
MEEGKGRGFDGTFRLSTLVVVVIFLPTAFLVLVDFHFILSLIITMVFLLSGLVVCSPDLDLGDLLVLLDLWLCRVFGDLCDLRSWLPIDWQFLLLVRALLSRAWCMLVYGVLRYFSVFGPQTCVVATMLKLFVSMVEGYDLTIAGSLHCIVQFSERGLCILPKRLRRIRASQGDL